VTRLGPPRRGSDRSPRGRRAGALAEGSAGPPAETLCGSRSRPANGGWSALDEADARGGVQRASPTALSRPRTMARGSPTSPPSRVRLLRRTSSRTMRCSESCVRGGRTSVCAWGRCCAGGGIGVSRALFTGASSPELPRPRAADARAGVEARAGMGAVSLRTRVHARRLPRKQTGATVAALLRLFSVPVAAVTHPLPAPRAAGVLARGRSR
jgi:hypothetical protein